MKMSLKLAAVMVVPMVGGLALGQMTGVSHPEEVPITTSSEGISQPIVYTPTPAAVAAQVKGETAAPVLKTRVAVVDPDAAEVQPVLRAASVTPVEIAAAPVRADLDTRLGMRAAGPDSEMVNRVEGPANQLPIGTMLKVRLLRELSTKTAKAGQEFKGELVAAVMRDGRVLLPVGSTVSGHVTDAHGGRRISGAASLHLQPTSVTLPDGTEYVLHGQVIDTDMYRSTKVDSEGSIVTKDHAAKTTGVLALTTGSGAAAGALIAGLPGALIGGGIGAGVGTVMWLKKERQEDLPAETKVVFALTSPMVVGER